MGQSSGAIGGWLPAIDPGTGGLVLPLWLAAVIVALLVAFGLMLLGRFDRDRIIEKLSRAGLVLVGIAAVWVILEALSVDRFANERTSLDARVRDMTTQAVVPGSALSCLSGTAGETVEASCEKALFASPEATAAAVAYVAAQVSVLADAGDYERRSARNYESALSGIRFALETDRFGIVAHVLDSYGCTAEQCVALALLRDRRQVSENLNSHKYEFLVARHATDWAGTPSATPPPVAVNVPSTAPLPPPSPLASAAPAAAAPVATAKKNFFLPSSASIPPISIMAPEPALGPQQGATDAGAKPAADPPAKPAPPAPTRKTVTPPPARPNTTGSTTPLALQPSAAASAAPAAVGHPPPGQATAD
jgi:hypothetical protein